MTLGEKIRQLRKKKGLSLTALEQKLASIFGTKALRYNSLYRIEKGIRDARVGSLSQICTGLGVSLKELKEGTEKEESYLVDFIKRRDKIAYYLHSDKARVDILTSDKQPFAALRLILKPQGKSKTEQDPIELGKYTKWIYGLSGKITCVVGQERHTLGKDEVITFDSTIPHNFENNSSKKASCLIIQNPKHI